MPDINKTRQNSYHWGTGQKEVTGLGAGCEWDSVVGEDKEGARAWKTLLQGQNIERGSV